MHDIKKPPPTAAVPSETCTWFIRELLTFTLMMVTYVCFHLQEKQPCFSSLGEIFSVQCVMSLDFCQFRFSFECKLHGNNLVYYSYNPLCKPEGQDQGL